MSSRVSQNVVNLVPDQFNQIYTETNIGGEVKSVYIRSSASRNFSSKLLEELNLLQDEVASIPEIKYLILGSDIEGVFSLGGDLKYFVQLIKRKDRQLLTQYMMDCLRLLSPERSVGLPYRVAVVEGKAFGGGFEAALACDYIIADGSAQFAFPEALFNMFPGMGGYSYLLRRTTPANAKKMVRSARIYSAKELLEMGIVDEIVEIGDARDAAMRHIADHKKKMNCYNAITTLDNMLFPLHEEELLRIGHLWVDAAINLETRDVTMMERIVKSQSKI